MQHHFFVLLLPRFSNVVLVFIIVAPVLCLLNESAPFADFIGYFSYFDEVLFMRVVASEMPGSSSIKIFEGFSDFMESKLESVPFPGRLILRLELGLTLISGRKD